MVADYEPTDLDAAAERDEDKVKTAEQKLQEERTDWRHLLSSAQGRRIVWALLEQTGVYKVSFSPEALQMAFNEGGRNIGLGILAKVMLHEPAAFLTMQREAK